MFTPSSIFFIDLLSLAKYSSLVFTLFKPKSFADEMVISISVSFLKSVLIAFIKPMFKSDTFYF